MSAFIYWCKQCNIPTPERRCPLCGYSGSIAATDVRPVFPEEVLLLGELLGKHGELSESSIWCGKNSYIVDGQPLSLPVTEMLNRTDLESIHLKMKEQLARTVSYEAFDLYSHRFTQAWSLRQKENDIAAQSFIHEHRDNPRNSKRVSMVSFSGGKDSTVVSDLVRRTLGTPEILHVFGNTTLELPQTYSYIDRFHKESSCASSRSTP